MMLYLRYDGEETGVFNAFFGCQSTKARENNRSKTMNGFPPFLTVDEVLLLLLPTFLAGISAAGGDSSGFTWGGTHLSAH